MPGHLNDGSGDRLIQSDPRHRAGRALAAHRGEFDGGAVGHDRKQRQHAGMGEINAVDRLAGFLQERALF